METWRGERASIRVAPGGVASPHHHKAVPLTVGRPRLPLPTTSDSWSTQRLSDLGCHNSTPLTVGRPRPADLGCHLLPPSDWYRTYASGPLKGPLRAPLRAAGADFPFQGCSVPAEGRGALAALRIKRGRRHAPLFCWSEFLGSQQHTRTPTGRAATFGSPPFHPTPSPVGGGFSNGARTCSKN